MHRFLRWYNQNREIFFIGLAMIVFIFIIIQVLNAIVGRPNEETGYNTEGNSSTNSTTISEPSTSVITGETMSEEETTSITNTIKQFVEYCNNGEIENAYNMLTDECKTLIYPTIESFTQNYYQRIFYINRMYSLENWYDDGSLYTYYIKYTEDVLASGNLNSEDNKGDYITVVETENDYRLNISSYVGREMMNDKVNSDNIVITVNWLDMYMDYTIANLSVTNNRESDISLDTKDGNYTMYMYDTNNVKYNSFLHENSEEQLRVRNGLTNTINIKFNKMYNPERELRGVIFSNVVLNYEDYISGTSEKNSITIKLEF